MKNLTVITMLKDKLLQSAREFGESLRSLASAVGLLENGVNVCSSVLRNVSCHGPWGAGT